MRSRSTLFCAALILFLPPASARIDRSRPATQAKEVTVTLVGRAGDLGMKVVNFGLPLPPGFLNDVGLVRVYREDGVEMEAAVRSLEPWRMDGKDGAMQEDFNRTARAFNWAFQASPQLVYFMQHPGAKR